MSERKEAAKPKRAREKKAGIRIETKPRKSGSESTSGRPDKEELPTPLQAKKAAYS